ncbi:MAG: DUF2383 domain-containing protein [Ferruginibacter sp.]
MTNTTTINEIQTLIRANYERMVAFEQASFHVTDHTLKNYFEEKAGESEMYINELNEVLSSLSGEKFDVEAYRQDLLGTTQLFTGQKNTPTILKHIQYLEKAIIKWYKAGMKNLKGISNGIPHILSKHSVGLEASHVYVKSY